MSELTQDQWRQASAVLGSRVRAMSDSERESVLQFLIGYAPKDVADALASVVDARCIRRRHDVAMEAHRCRSEAAAV